MIKFSIPGKTFLIGEYAATLGAPAILLTTTPCFAITLHNLPGLEGIHPESPAGRWWHDQPRADLGLTWHDPYRARGGLGASTAQFLGSYLAYAKHCSSTVNRETILHTYLKYAWSGEGIKPSGYDVLAQSQEACVYIEGASHTCETLAWPFMDLSFILLHTGKKLATHEHLQSCTKLGSLDSLVTLTKLAKQIFLNADSEQLIHIISAYHQELTQLNLVAEHTRHQIQILKSHPEILAIKGCGALGADVLLVLCENQRLPSLLQSLTENQYSILATHHSLYSKTKSLKLL